MGCKRAATEGKQELNSNIFLFRALKKIILASGSPRRRDFFNDLGFDFKVITADVDETPSTGENPQTFAVRMAQDKADAVAIQHQDSWVVGADTIVTVDGLILGKPKDADDALKMLMQLNGRRHTVITAYSLICRHEEFCQTRSVATEVFFHLFSEKVLSAYVQTGEPMDKAGAYGIQGIGSFLVRTINGSCTNVIGLPISDLVTDLLHARVIEPQ
jgi:septum formation protein